MLRTVLRRQAGRSLTRIGIALAGLFTLTGCYQTTGDFGRPTQGVWEASVLPFTGTVSARMRGEPASWYQLTEDEKDLRSRAWRFLNPERDAPVLTAYQDALAYHRLLPPREFDVTLYHRTVMGGPYLGSGVGDSPTLRAMIGTGYGGGTFRSLTSRYNRTRDTILQDHQLIPHFRLIAAQVVEADRVRARALDHVGNLTDEHREEAIRRICENALLINRVNWAFHDRAAMYRYSLEHLLVEGPEREAIPSERTLMAFERDIAELQKTTTLPPGCGANEEAVAPPHITPMPLVRKY
jgi:hypothetical protein